MSSLLDQVQARIGPPIVDGPCCSGCDHRFTGVRFIPPDGLGTNHVMLLGDSGWLAEAEAGKPFQGASGYYIDRQLRRLGLLRDQFLIGNVLWCRAKALGWTDYPEKYPDAAAAIRHCSPYLDEFISQHQPRCIVTLGAVALRRATGLAGVEANQGYVIDSSWSVPVIPTFHPSYIIRGNQNLSGAFCLSIKKAVELAANGFKRDQFDLLCDPQLDQFRAYFSEWDERLLIADIETAYSTKWTEDEATEDDSNTIVRISFSTKRGTAVSVPWTPPFIQECLAVLGIAKEVVFWNQAFDAPRLRAVGARLNKVTDAMWCWHFLQSDLPKALGFVAPFYTTIAPWKHMADVNPAFYSAMDSAVTMQCYEGIKQQLLAEGRWDAFERHCTATLPLLEAMGSQGIKVDAAEQIRFKEQIERELVEVQARLQALVPDSVKRMKVAKKKPKDDGWEEFTEPAEVKVRKPADAGCLHCGGVGWLPSGDKRKVCGCRWLVEVREVVRWRKRLEFNPGSPKQVAELVKVLGLRVPITKDAGDGSRETTEAKYLKRFAKRNPVFQAILDCREREKLLNTYIWPLPESGRITTQYGFHPSTWRKSSRDVNLQNLPKRSDLAQQFRKMLVAEEGYVLVESDAAAIEAVLVGYCAGSERYIRLAKAGVHDWVTAELMGDSISLDLPFTELRNRCKEVKKRWPKEREMVKRVVHLSNYLGTPNRILQEYPEYFSRLDQAKRLQDAYFETDAGKDVRAWHKTTLDRAHQERYLDNHWRYRHYFYCVYQWNTEVGDWVMGDDAKRAVAFVPQSDASAIQTEVLLAVPDWLRPHLRLIIHDAIVLEVPEADTERAAQEITGLMVQPWAQLGGLAIGAETKVGHSLACMEEIVLT